MVREATAPRGEEQAFLAKEGSSLQLPQVLSEVIKSLEWLQLFLSVTAAIYPWILPLLQQASWAHTCVTQTHDGEVYAYPHCIYYVEWAWLRKILEFLHLHVWVESGVSVSDYIANAQATGGMGTVNFWPCMHLFLPSRWVNSWAAYVSLMVFEVFFGLFLMNPVTRGFCTHSFVVSIFCQAGIAHMTVMLGQLDHLEPWRQRLCRICAYGANIGLLGVIVTGVTCLFTNWLGTNMPFLFWTCESLGLSSMSLFALFWKSNVTSSTA